MLGYAVDIQYVCIYCIYYVCKYTVRVYLHCTCISTVHV